MSTKRAPDGTADLAIAYMAEHGVNAYQAAKVFGIKPPTIYNRQKRLAAQTICPCCKQPIPQKA